MRALLLLTFFSILFLFCCTPISNQGPECLPADAALSWSIRSNFKVDFQDKGAAIEVLQPGQQRLLLTIMNQVKEGELNAFDMIDYHPLKGAELNAIFSSQDTMTVLDPDEGDFIERVITNELNLEAVKKARIKEEWYYDKKAKKMYSKIIGVAPVETIYNSDGSPRGDHPLFWVFFDEVPISSN